MAMTSFSDHEVAPNVLRQQLLIELSVLRRRYAQLAGSGGADDERDRREPLGGTAESGSAAPSSGSGPEGGDEGSCPLGQSDRDAIEALFNSVDDFTRDFNEGSGGLDRNDIVARITRGAM